MARRFKGYSQDDYDTAITQLARFIVNVLAFYGFLKLVGMWP